MTEGQPGNLGFLDTAQGKARTPIYAKFSKPFYKLISKQHDSCRDQELGKYGHVSAHLVV